MPHAPYVEENLLFISISTCFRGESQKRSAAAASPDLKVSGEISRRRRWVEVGGEGGRGQRCRGGCCYERETIKKVNQRWSREERDVSFLMLTQSNMYFLEALLWVFPAFDNI